MTNNNSSNNNSNIPKKSYEQLKEELKRKIDEKKSYDSRYNDDVKLLIRDMVAVLRTVEKKERAAVTQQIKNDFLDVLGRSTIYNLLKEIYEEGLEIKKAEKQKIMVGADGNQILEEGEDGEGSVAGENDDIYSKRKKAKDELETRTIRKGSSQMPKLRPSVTGESELEDEEEQNQEQEQEQYEETDEITTLRESNNVVIEDEDHLREIAELLKQGKAVVIIVNQHLQVTGISAGKSLS